MRRGVCAQRLWPSVVRPGGAVAADATSVISPPRGAPPALSANRERSLVFTTDRRRRPVRSQRLPLPRNRSHCLLLLLLLLLSSPIRNVKNAPTHDDGPLEELFIGVTVLDDRTRRRHRLQVVYNDRRDGWPTHRARPLAESAVMSWNP